MPDSAPRPQFARSKPSPRAAITFELVGVKVVRAFDANVVIASLIQRGDAGPDRLLGCYLADGDMVRGRRARRSERDEPRARQLHQHALIVLRPGPVRGTRTHVHPLLCGTSPRRRGGQPRQVPAASFPRPAADSGESQVRVRHLLIGTVAPCRLLLASGHRAASAHGSRRRYAETQRRATPVDGRRRRPLRPRRPRRRPRTSATDTAASTVSTRRGAARHRRLRRLARSPRPPRRATRSTSRPGTWTSGPTRRRSVSRTT